MTDRRRPLVSRLTVGQWLGLATGTLVVIAAAALIAGVLAVSRLTDARELLVDRLDPARISVSRLSNAFLNQESGVRGYVLGGQKAFLDPYTRGAAQEITETATLERLARGAETMGIRADLARVKAAATAWKRDYAQPSLAAGANASKSATIQRAGLGKDRFDVLRANLTRLSDDLIAAREHGRDKLQSAANALTATFVAIAVALVAGGILVLVMLRVSVSTPLTRLSRRVRRVAQGAFDQRLASGGARDVVELAEDVDSMRVRIVSELTEVEEARSRLAEQARDLQRSNDELEQFAYVASHDLQEPLRKVASFTQLLQKRYGGELDERADQYIEFAADGAKRMQQLINDLLAFSRVGRLSSEQMTVFPADEALALALDALGAPIADQGATIDAGPLPEVRGERALIAAVFQNLIGNAVKFSRPDVPPEVAVRARRNGDVWEFVVSDNGIGVEADYAERIFVIFQRLHPKDEYAGTGIGLAMCRKIVEYHGGRIWLDTDPARTTGGTVFHFTLPALPTPATETETPR